MKVYNSSLLTKLTGIVGVTGISLLIGLPVKANNALNSNPSVFTEASQTQTVSSNTNVSVTRTKVSDKPNKILLAQGGVLNPRPSILDECPYNRAACDNNIPSTTSPAPLPPSTSPVPPTTVPGTVPPLPGTEVPAVPPETSPGAGTENQDIIAVVDSNPSFTMLAKALRAAGLVEALKGDGPLTVLAPNDAAFAKLPQDAVQDLLKPENKEVLVKILTYHVIPNRVLSTDLRSGEVRSLEGGPISVKVDPASGVQVNDATVVQPDVRARNGVIHIIDNVILPPDL